MGMNKRGQGLPINSIILIVLGILVLAMLIVGFTMGWTKVLPFIKPSNNVDTLVSQCSVACNMEEQYNYCSKPISLYAEGGVKIEDTTCYILAKKKTEYGVDVCSAINCAISDDLETAKTTCTAEGQDIKYINELKIGSYACLESDVVVPSTA